MGEFGTVCTRWRVKIKIFILFQGEVQGLVMKKLGICLVEKLVVGALCGRRTSRYDRTS